VSSLLALLHWPDFGGMIVDSSDSNTSSEILPKKKALFSIGPFFNFWSLTSNYKKIVLYKAIFVLKTIPHPFSLC